MKRSLLTISVLLLAILTFLAYNKSKSNNTANNNPNDSLLEINDLPAGVIYTKMEFIDQLKDSYVERCSRDFFDNWLGNLKCKKVYTHWGKQLYYIEGNEVCYVKKIISALDDCQDPFDNEILINADAKTFQAYKLPDYHVNIIGEHGPVNEYAKDKQNVFFKGQVIKGADTNTFHTLDGPVSSQITDSLTKIGSTTKKYNFSYYYAADKHHVYCNGIKLNGADAKSFEIIQYGASSVSAKDKKHNYLGCEPTNDLQDNNYIRLDNSEFYKNSSSAKFKELIIQGADIASFHFIGDSYAADKNNVYFTNFIVTGADPASFVRAVDWIFKDKNNLYALDEKIGGMNPNNFRRVGPGVYKDDDHVWVSNFIIEEADAKTFEIMKKDGKETIVEGYRIKALYKDSKNIYCIDETNHNFYYKEANKIILHGLDTKSFEYLGNGWSRDKNSIYYCDKKTQLDRNTFQVPKDDKLQYELINKVYYN